MRTLGVCVFLTLLFCAEARADLVLRLEAANYNPATGTWTDTSGLNNHANQGNAALRPMLVLGQTLSGMSVVRFDGINDRLDLTSLIGVSAANGITAFVFLRPSDATSVKTMISGPGAGTYQYRIHPDKQQLIRSGVQLVGAGNTAISTTDFSSINLKANNAGGSFRLNGLADGTFGAPAAGFGSISTIGVRAQFNNEKFIGDIAEIRLYNMQLTADQIAAVEAEFAATYNAVPEPSTFALLTFAGFAFATRRRRTVPG